MYKTIDLFAGAGGLSYGFEETGAFKMIAAAELNKNASNTYKLNHSDCVKMISDVRGYDFKKLAEEVGGIDVVIGGPPCQGFSNANRQKNRIISMNNALVKEYFRVIREVRPRAFVMENVSMIMSETHRFYDSEIDHDEIARLKIPTRRDCIIIAPKNYESINSLEALTSADSWKYQIPEKLFHLLNVLSKDCKRPDRYERFINKNASALRREIAAYNVSVEKKGFVEYPILYKVLTSIDTSSHFWYEQQLREFISFQKSFHLKKELDDNKILYDLEQNIITTEVDAYVDSYSVKSYVEKILDDTYQSTFGILNSLYFGVPQERRRFIMIGIRSDLLKTDMKLEMPKGTTTDHFVTVWEAISDLMDYPTVQNLADANCIPYKNNDQLTPYEAMMRKDSKGVNNHIVTSTTQIAHDRFETLKEGQNFHQLSKDLITNYTDPSRTQNSIYLRLTKNEPSSTVTNVRKAMWIHPKLNRAISVREAARLQSFPDRFIFTGTKDSQYQQVGNAVPPLLAKGIAEHLLKYLEQ